jgi:hypothetical protein
MLIKTSKAGLIFLNGLSSWREAALCIPGISGKAGDPIEITFVALKSSAGQLKR